MTGPPGNLAAQVENPPITLGLLLSNVITGGVLVLGGSGMVSLAAMKARG